MSKSIFQQASEDTESRAITRDFITRPALEVIGPDGNEFIPLKPEENTTIKQPVRTGPPKTQVDHLVNSFRKLSFPQKQQFLNKIKTYLQ